MTANLSGRALCAPRFDSPEQPNSARFNYLDPAAQQFFPEWENKTPWTSAPPSAPKPAATATTAPSSTSSVNSQPAVRQTAHRTAHISGRYIGQAVYGVFGCFLTSDEGRTIANRNQ